MSSVRIKHNIRIPNLQKYKLIHSNTQKQFVNQPTNITLSSIRTSPTLKPIFKQFQNIRVEKQQINNNMVYNALKNKDKIQLLNVVNEKELKRVLDNVDLSLDELIDKCSMDDCMNIILSGRISKNASRQGTKDEEIQLQVCNDLSKHFGIYIEKPNVAYRPTKNGEIITQREMKQRNISKDMCLKSFDGKISGNINGWIFAKIVYSNGGHQDNVFEEADTLCEWVVKHRINELYSNELFIIMIDTNLINKVIVLKHKYKHVNKIMITNHYEFQQFIMDTFG